MILPKATDAIHKAWMYRVLTAIANDSFLAQQLCFKGGTCAAMRGLLDRFSVDLDFDLFDVANLEEVRDRLEGIFDSLGLEIKDQSEKVPQYFLKYPNKHGDRNTLKLDVTFPAPKSNEYEMLRLVDIDRILKCQTVETMFANKLVAVLDRYERHGSIAGRDIFDIHSFLLAGFGFNEAVIEERRGGSVADFLSELREFIESRVDQKVLDQDLNVLLPPEKFKEVRKRLKQEVLAFLV